MESSNLGQSSGALHNKHTTNGAVTSSLRGADGAGTSEPCAPLLPGVDSGDTGYLTLRSGRRCGPPMEHCRQQLSDSSAQVGTTGLPGPDPSAPSEVSEGGSQPGGPADADQLVGEEEADDSMSQLSIYSELARQVEELTVRNTELERMLMTPGPSSAIDGVLTSTGVPQTRPCQDSLGISPIERRAPSDAGSHLSRSLEVKPQTSATNDPITGALREAYPSLTDGVTPGAVALPVQSELRRQPSASVRSPVACPPPLRFATSAPSPVRDSGRTPHLSGGATAGPAPSTGEFDRLRRQVADLSLALEHSQRMANRFDQPHTRALIPDKFSLGMDWQSYAVRFVEAAGLNRWDPYEAAIRLRFCLSSEVHELIDKAVVIPPRCSITQLLELLTPLLTPVNEADTAEAQLAERVKKADETFQHFSIALQKLCWQAFPEDSPKGHIRRLQRKFVEGCGDAELARFILEREITSADQLVYLAEKHRSISSVVANCRNSPLRADSWLPGMVASTPAAPSTSQQSAPSATQPNVAYQAPFGQQSTPKPSSASDLRGMIKEELDAARNKISNRLGNLERRVARQDTRFKSWQGGQPRANEPSSRRSGRRRSTGGSNISSSSKPTSGKSQLNRQGPSGTSSTRRPKNSSQR